MFPICTLIRKSVRVLTAAAALAFLCTPVQASAGPPVQLSLATADAPRPGQPSTIYVVLQAGADVDLAEYNLATPEGWQVVEGPTRWTGSLKQGQRLEFQLRAVPFSETPGELHASVHIADQRDYVATLSPERMGGRFPEKGAVEDPASVKGLGRAAEAAIEPVFDPTYALPAPANATEPQIPGQAPKNEPIHEAAEPKSGKGQRAASVSINATGRFTYLDDNNIRRGVRFATVELWNENSFPFPDERCATGVTDAAGNFSLGASCGDLFDGPDLFVRLVLNNSVVEVKPDNVFAGTYTFKSSTRQNSSGGNVNFGTLTASTNKEAIQTHNIVMRAHQFMTTQGENMSKVTVLWPGDATFYQGAFDSITVERPFPFSEEGAIYHEYGHHVLDTKAESPSPDYNNGICDDPTPGHCLFSPEKGVISWTEGFADFFGAVLHDMHNAEDGYGPTIMSFANIPSVANFAGQEDHIEGVIAAILWDLTSNPGDVIVTFNQLWRVIRDFDPSANLFHNHPTSIHELWGGLQEMQTNRINRVSAVYVAHGISKPQPDLTVTALENPPTQLPRGTTFTLTSTVRNEGNERANSAFTVRFELFQRVIGRGGTVIGTRTVNANLAAGASNTASVNVAVPATMLPGTYLLRACVDTGSTVPESDESNNCRTASSTVVQ